MVTSLLQTTHDINQKGSDKGPDTVLLQKLYYDMLLIRRFEEKAGQLYGMGEIGGFCHLYIGQEAVVVGMQAALKPQDSIITAYRDHGHMLACGMTPEGVMAELTGREDGYSKGKGGSMHMFSREKNFFGGHGIVGAQIPLGTGLAFAHKYREDGGCTVASMGDGGCNQGQVYEAFNMAKLWMLPIIFVIENNEYAMGTSVARHAATTDLYKRGLAHDIPGLQVDGMNVINVLDAAHIARNHVAAGKGPILLEMKTYRYRGHSMSDPATYRAKEEVADVKEVSDPIDALKTHLIETCGIAEDTLKKIDKDIRAHMKKVADFALASPHPDASELYTDILKETAE